MKLIFPTHLVHCDLLYESWYNKCIWISETMCLYFPLLGNSRPIFSHGWLPDNPDPISNGNSLERLSLTFWIKLFPPSSTSTRLISIPLAFLNLFKAHITIWNVISHVFIICVPPLKDSIKLRPYVFSSPLYPLQTL